MADDDFSAAVQRAKKRQRQFDWYGHAMVALFVALTACIVLSVCAVSVHWALRTWGLA